MAKQSKKDNRKKSTTSVITNSFIKGMNKDITQSMEPAQSWWNARNAANNSNDGDLGVIGNEPSNLQCGVIPYTLIGAIQRYGDEWIVYSTDNISSEIGRFDDSEVAENDTYGVKYTMGSITAAYQITKVDYSAAATADQDADHVGVSIAVNENLSVSIGRQKVGIDLAVDDEVNTGLNASYTMGSITLGGGFNSVESAGGVQAADAEVAMLNASFAF